MSVGITWPVGERSVTPATIIIPRMTGTYEPAGPIIPVVAVAVITVAIVAIAVISAVGIATPRIIGRTLRLITIAASRISACRAVGRASLRHQQQQNTAGKNYLPEFQVR